MLKCEKYVFDMYDKITTRVTLFQSKLLMFKLTTRGDLNMRYFHFLEAYHEPLKFPNDFN